MASYSDYDSFRSEINLVDTGEVNRATVERLLLAASAAIDRHCNRPLGFLALAVATVKVYPGTGYAYQLIDECTEVSEVAVKDSVSDTTYTAWTTDDWDACTGDYNYPDFNSTPYTMLVCTPNGDYSVFTSGKYSYRWQAPTVQVTAKWGYATTVPYQIKEATIMQAARWYKRLQGAMSDALASGELGRLMYVQELDPDIVMILKRGRFVHPAVGRW